MVRIQLRVYVEPGRAEVFVNIKRKDRDYEKRSVVVDTGAQVSLLPKLLMSVLEYRLSERGTFTVEQAGIAVQTFQATEAFVTVYFEDQTGARTEEFEARVWFADTDVELVGFNGILDQTILHLDMPNRTGYLDFTR